MTAALQMIEAVQTILVESDGTSITLEVSNAGISGPRGFTGPQGPPGPPGPLSVLTDLSDVALELPEDGPAGERRELHAAFGIETFDGLHEPQQGDLFDL